MGVIFTSVCIQGAGAIGRHDPDGCLEACLGLGEFEAIVEFESLVIQVEDVGLDLGEFALAFQDLVGCGGLFLAHDLDVIEPTGLDLVSDLFVDRLVHHGPRAVDLLT